jgi:hypothetical protein
MFSLPQYIVFDHSLPIRMIESSLIEGSPYRRYTVRMPPYISETEKKLKKI